MGCCASKPQNEPSSSDHPLDRHDESSQAITADASQPLETIPSASSNLVTSTSRASRSRRQVPTTERAPAPLRAHTWTSKHPWTRSQLIEQRRIFFETQVSGNPEIWGTLKVVVESLADGDIQLAQSIVDAAEIVVPTGNLKNGAYDNRGHLYQIPEHIICDPVNVIQDRPSLEGKEETSPDESDDDARGMGKKHGEKGKAVIMEEELITVKARLSDRGGPDVIVQMLKSQTVRWLIKRIQEDPSVNGDTKMKIAYLGKIFKENKSLQAQGWREGHVVNALVFQ